MSCPIVSPEEIMRMMIEGEICLKQAITIGAWLNENGFKGNLSRVQTNNMIDQYTEDHNSKPGCRVCANWVEN
jgi:hypothetical protein